LQENEIRVVWGHLPLERVELEVPAGVQVVSASGSAGDIPLDLAMRQDGGRVALNLPEGTRVEEGQALQVRLEW
jgi:hypothetical protein